MTSTLCSLLLILLLVCSLEGSASQRLVYRLHSQLDLSGINGAWDTKASITELDSNVALEIWEASDLEVDGGGHVVAAEVLSCKERTGLKGKGKWKDCYERQKRPFLFGIDSQGALYGMYSLGDIDHTVEPLWNLALGFSKLMAPVNLTITEENRPFGRCQVTFTNKGDSLSQLVDNCKSWNSGDAHDLANSLLLNYAQQTVFYQDSDKIVTSAVSGETFDMVVPLFHKATYQAHATHNIKLIKRDGPGNWMGQYCMKPEDTVRSCISSLAGWVRLAAGWETFSVAALSTMQLAKHKSIKPIIENYNNMPYSDEFPEETKAAALLDLVNGLTTDLDEVKSAFNDPKKSKIHELLVDSVAAIDRFEVHLMRRDLMSKLPPKLFQRFMSRLAFSKPREWLIDNLLTWCETRTTPMDIEIKETLLRTVSTLIGRLCRLENTCQDDGHPLIRRIVKLAELTLESAVKLDGPEQLQTVRVVVASLENLGSKLVFSILHPFMCPESSAVIFDDILFPEFVLKAVAAVPSEFWSDTDVELLFRAFSNQCPVRLTSRARSQAAQVLVQLSKLRPGLIDALLGKVYYVQSNAERELFQYTVEELVSKHGMAVVTEHLKDESIFNWNALAFGSMSGVYAGVLSTINDQAAVYDLSMGFTDGILKHSGLHVSWEANNISYPLVSFSLFSQGIESLLGSDSEVEPEEKLADEEITAGMQLGFFGSQQLPLHFFHGQSELMSAVWGADGSEMTAFEGNFLLHDYNVAVPFSSGHLLRVVLYGAVSVKISGAIEVSLWYRTSRSVITTKAGLVVKGMAILSSAQGVVQSNQMELNTTSNIDFVTDVEFYEKPFKICMRMDHPDFVLRHTTNDEKHRKLSTRLKVPGRSFITNPKSSSLCSEYKEHFGL